MEALRKVADMKRAYINLPSFGPSMFSLSFE
jgi:hypothetical protein